jgi:hypothetical protein
MDWKLGIYLAGLVFATGIALAEFRRLKKDFDEHETEVDGDIKGLRERKASKKDLDEFKTLAKKDTDGIGRKCDGVKGEVEELRAREDRRFREVALILGRMTEDPAIQQAIQHMASRNGG